MMASGKRAFFSEIPSHRKLIMKDLAACPLILYKRWEARIRDLFLTLEGSRKLLVLQTTFVLAL